MRPDFALSLSFEGIALLRRTPKGWTVIGDVSLTSPDLNSALAKLRKTADGLSPSGGHVKLIIPNEQIRYLTIPDTGATDAALTQQIKAALDGATPYAVSDLVFDWSVSGGQVKVAAVARETLTEAEVFSAGHHFVPVCHVASPPEGAFDGEVFFGAATGWSGPSPERDDREVVVSSQAEPTAAPAAKPPAPAATPPAPAATPPAPAAKPPAPAAKPPAPAAKPPAPAAKPTAPAAAVSAPSAAPPDDTPAPVAFTSMRAQRGVSAPAAGLNGAGKAPDLDSALPPRNFAFKSKPEVAAEPALPKTGKVTDGAIAGDDLAETGRGLSKLAGFGFLSRRKAASGPGGKTKASASSLSADPALPPIAPKPPPKPVRTSALQAQQAAAAGAATLTAPTEQQKMTVFGARDAAKVGGKPRHLGLMLTSALLLLLLGVAAWATVYFDEVVSRVFGPRDPVVVEQTQDAPPPVVASTVEEAAELQITAELEEAADLEEVTSPDQALPVTPPVQAQITAPDNPSPQAESSADIELASLTVSIPDQDNTPAPLEALSQPMPPEELSPEQAAATYAATGLWLRAPLAPELPAIAPQDDVTAAGIDPVTASFDAIALDRPNRQNPDATIPAQQLPFGPDVRFRMNAQGLVLAEPDGALSPEGVRVFAGAPPVQPPVRPQNAALFAQNPELLAQFVRMRSVRPALRPGNLTERNERAQLSGLSRQELGRIRPVARKASLQQQAEQSPDATALAVDRSPRPVVRPRDFASIVDAARSTAPQTTTQVAAVAPRNVQPDIPSTASVARQATVSNAINLRRLNLIGVYGKSNDRRALVRLPNGQFEKVQVGDRLDGGRVAAISDDALRYTKGGRTVTLEMP